MKLNDRLAEIQKNLKAPKGQYNNFGKYKYRSCEDIVEAVKQLLDGLTLTISDEIVMVGDRFYVKATVILSDGENKIQTTAFARESLDKKGMDDSQITGACSSYARKYALNGMFAIDDTKDADTDEHGKDEPKGREPTKVAPKVDPPKEVPKEEPPARRRVPVATSEAKPEAKKEEVKKETKPSEDQW